MSHSEVWLIHHLANHFKDVCISSKEYLSKFKQLSNKYTSVRM